MQFQKKTKNKKYPSELSEKSWKRLKSLLPKQKKVEGEAGRSTVELREVINGILYVLRSGCSWRMMPIEITINRFPFWVIIRHHSPRTATPKYI